MNKKLSLTIFLIFFFVSLFSQTNSYKISVTIKGIPDTVLYLVGNYGKEELIVDSARVNEKFTALFKGENELFSGIYSVQNRETKCYLDVIIDKNRHFSISTSLQNIMKKREIIGSDENQLLFEVEKMAMLSVLTPTSTQKILENYSEISPNTLLSKFLKATALLKIPADIEQDSLQMQQYKRIHYFDNFDVNDARLLRVPFTAEKVFYYFTTILPHDADTISYYLNLFLNKITDQEVLDYYLELLFKYYSSYKSPPELDGVSVNIYDNFCADKPCTFIAPEMRRIIYNKIERKRQLLPGKTILPLLAVDADSNCVRTDQISADYIIVWFWEPDCDGCIELTPVLHDFYEQNRAKLNFEVYAVALTEDEHGWLEFIDEHHLDWINVSCVHGLLDYDFIDYFDIVTTPCVFLIDKNHKIITRELSFNKMKKLMEKTK